MNWIPLQGPYFSIEVREKGKENWRPFTDVNVEPLSEQRAEQYCKDIEANYKNVEARKVEHQANNQD